ncbi:unnamed protein product [Candidula unifasciata]|uniref:Uncharacterized protein n=1 Tax=Candidula unifasciata TaxID=100452 RepID=A0A8S3ZST3_9EUPU|nr:unnamed protein product [Candidula unifasciata]
MSTSENTLTGSVPAASREPATTNGSTGITPVTPDTGRSLIVDERFFEEQFLRCQICHEKFDQMQRSPKSLPCNHTFCMPCLTQIFDHAQPSARRSFTWAHESLDGTLKCPTCRVEIFLSRNKIRDLPNDHRVVQMMDFLSQAVAKSQNVCSKHDGQPLNFFCKKCLSPVCRDCTVLDHKESDGHAIVDLSDAINENATHFNELEVKSRDTLEKMKTRSDSLANASKRLDILERQLKSEIKETFIEYRLLLEKRQEALTSMVNQIIKDQKAKVNAKFAYVCEHGTQLQKLYDELKSSRDSNDIRKLFIINQQMKDQESRFTDIAAQDDTDLFHSCEFEAQNEGCFLSDLSSLGEVRPKVDPELTKPVTAQQLVILDREARREQELLMENEESNNVHGDEFLTTREMMNLYHNDDVEAGEDDQDTEGYWPSHSLMSDLMNYYATLAATAPESMDESDSIASGGRRSRRGRRPRDTNSFQLHSTTPAVVRSGSRNRAPASTGSAYRVVRHSTASTLRNQPPFGNEESNFYHKSRFYSLSILFAGY